MGQSKARKVCELCGNPLPTRPKGKAGPNHLYCYLEETARPCARFAKRFQECRRFAEAILDRSPSSTRDRARFRIRAKYAEVGRELKQLGE